MFDMHYDLLTFAYITNRQGKNIKKLLKQVKKSKVFGLTVNLYFMSKEEMETELDYPDDLDVLKMFKEAKSILEKNIDIKLLYSIEGCGYIKNTNELEKLYKEGLDAIILVWNDLNKYGSGNYTNKGLTEEGKIFIRKAIDLSLAIDLSHANKNTFDDIINEIKKSKKEVIVYASHSNIKSVYDNPRNLAYDQIQKLKEVGGYLGIVSYPKFLTLKKDNKSIKDAYVKHIIKAVKIMGIDYVFLSSDNMDYLKQISINYNSAKAPYPYQKMPKQIKKDLSSYFTNEEIDKIMYKNALKIYTKLKDRHL